MLSIVIPTFNACENIGSALDSILSQNFRDYEVIIIDGCSSDNTLHIIKEYAKKNNFIQWSSEKDKGVYDAMNKGIVKARGRWIYFLGADDKLHSDTILTDMFQHPGINTCNVIYGNVEIIGDTSWAKNGAIYDGEFTIEKLWEKNICHQGIFYKSSIFKEIGFFNTKYAVCADWDLNHRCFAKGRIQYIQQTVAKFYTGGISSNNKSDGFYEDAVFNLKKYYGIGYLNHLFHLLSDAFHLNAVGYLKKGNYWKAIQFFLFYLYHEAFLKMKRNFSFAGKAL